MILLHLSEVAAVNGYYWSFARSFFNLKIIEKTQEKEPLNETSDSLKVDNEKILLDNQNKSLESPKVDNEEISSPGENVEQNEDDKNSNVLENSVTNTIENDNKMKSIDMSKLEEVVTGTGYFHSLQVLTEAYFFWGFVHFNEKRNHYKVILLFVRLSVKSLLLRNT